MDVNPVNLALKEAVKKRTSLAITVKVDIHNPSISITLKEMK